VTPPKPAANPLQFIKVGPASLYKSAQEQLKKVEEIKKVTKEVRDEAEDWQSVSDDIGVIIQQGINMAFLVVTDYYIYVLKPSAFCAYNKSFIYNL
jgi:hypothetical protein